ARPLSLPGSQIGVSLYIDRVDPVGVLMATEGTASAYIAWEQDRLEFLAEYLHIAHTLLAGGDETANHAYYAQLAYRLPGQARAWKPYVRGERITIAQNDVVFAPLLLGYDGLTAGIRYDFAADD